MTSAKIGELGTLHLSFRKEVFMEKMSEHYLRVLRFYKDNGRKNGLKRKTEVSVGLMLRKFFRCC